MTRGPGGSVSGRNPYLNRVMIRRVADFYGRRREVAKIFARIGAARPQSVSIVGDRRIGKSSLLHYLSEPEIRRQHLDDPDGYTFVLIDLQEQREIGIPAFFESLFQGIEHALGRERRPGVPADYETARRALVRLQEEGRKIVLLFDEFDAITRNPNFPEEFFSFLRAVANKYDVAYVTTSGRDLQQLCHAERIADSPFFNIFSNLFLTRFEPDDALALIREPSVAAGVPLAAHAGDIIEMAGLFPFFLQIACSACFEELAGGGLLDLERVRKAFAEEAEPHFNYLLAHFDEDQRRVLRDLVVEQPVPPSLSYLVGKLRRDGYLLEQQGRDRLFSSVFAEFVRGGRFSESSAQRSGGTPGGDAGQSEPRPIQNVQNVSGTARPLSLEGRQVGSFKIVALIGSGGMGEVYRARDLKLERDVAVKVMSGALAADQDRLSRFEREAKLLAALNHPHIAAIYGIEDSAGVHALILELVEGPTLAERIAASRGLATLEALALARQIADALAAAHAKGILHRDLKPANVKVTRDGTVKVLDFGLAKIWTPEGQGRSAPDAPTASVVQTRIGVVLGTAAYMSPEQVRGQALDKRTDIWSFGCVLFEMLTGRVAFSGPTVSDTLAHVLEREPDWRALPAGVPAPLVELLRRCLQKDQNRRLHDIADARVELDEIAAGGRHVGGLRRLFGKLTRRA